MPRASLIALAASLAAASAAAAQEPPRLPAGLAPVQPDKNQDSDQASEPKADQAPALPAGLTSPSAPALPAGLGEAGPEQTDQAQAPQEPRGAPWLGERLTGFVETRAGVRVKDDPNQDAVSIGEARLRLESSFEPGPLVVRLVGDVVLDAVADDLAVDLETGDGAFDLREANIVWRPASFMDLKIGRQILTWGVGDLVFINDLFPKDFQSFFIGRDDEYLKAPSDALRASFFTDWLNLEMVYTPRFDADRYLDGSRLSYFNPLLGGKAGENAVIEPRRPDDWFEDDEFAARAYRQAGSYEIAAYAYRGFHKSPAGLDPAATPAPAFTFPKLSVYGASLRGPLAGGIVSAEAGRYVSHEDKDGDNPFIPNDETRLLVGFEREAAQELTVAVQYYAQIRGDHDAFLAALPPGQRRPDETRHLTTVRVTKLAMNQNLTVSAFNFWSPNEDDGHLRVKASYKVSDAWRVEGGANVFYGPREDGFFSQLNDNANVFVAARRSF